ncbi:MAG: tRNA (guanosine(46)-N7)-methyltransferase TrmB [Magnetococcales bacterium]|nr:tRNA (guanosine(46)-N7)-methyltransferase TrmB [Magnetococcales bacterium]
MPLPDPLPTPASPQTEASAPLTDPSLIPRGRKKGKTGPQALRRLEQLLPMLELPVAADRGALLAQWGTDASTARLFLEVGFGNGHTLATLAARHPQDRFIGVEVFLGGVASLLLRIQQEGLVNIRIATQGIHAILAERIPPASLDRVLIHFPDPWPKRSHHKRRLIQTPFLHLLASRMTPSAQLSLATDWSHYAQWMLALLEGDEHFVNLGQPGQFAPEPPDWVETRFQRKAQAEGRPVFHLLYGLADPGK